MAEISFYHLTSGQMEKSAARLLDKVYEAKMKAILLLKDQDELDRYDTVLWTFSSKVFLPHGSSKDGNPECQPVWLTTTLENPNNAEILVSTSGQQIEDFGKFKRCLDIFNGHDDDAVIKARKRWKYYKDSNHTLTYWKQNEKGVWGKQEL